MSYTKDNVIAEMTELHEKAKALVEQHNELMLDGLSASIVDAKLDSTLKEYATLAKTLCNMQLKEFEDPMLQAIKQMHYKVLVAKDERNTQDKTVTRKLVETDKVIDILGLHNSIKDGIGKDKNWNLMIEKLNYLLTIKRAQELGIKTETICKTYNLQNVAREYDMGKDPTSKTNLLKTLQRIVASMIGEEYKPLSHDVNYLLSIFSRKARNIQTVKCATHTQMRQYLMEICNRIVYGKSYNIEYTKIKEKS